jgi:hypothetical protein
MSNGVYATVLCAAAAMVTRYGRAAGTVLRKRAEDARRGGDEPAARAIGDIAEAADALNWGRIVAG